MKMHLKIGFLGLIAATAVSAKADYILDVPIAQTGVATTWTFRDTDATKVGNQVNAWASLEDGAVVFKTDSTVDANGASAGVRTFGKWGGFGSNRVVRFDYILDGGGLMLVKAVTASGDGVMITPQYLPGMVAPAVKLTNIGLGSAVKVTRTGNVEDGYPWNYVDCDYILDGPQIMVWADYNSSKGAITFRSDSTSLATDGTAAGVKTINSYGTSGNRVNTPTEVYSYGGKIFAVATTAAYGSTPVVFTPNFNPKQTMTPLMPEILSTGL